MKSLRELVPTPVRLLAARILPYPSRLSSPNVSDISSLAISCEVYVQVYWLSPPPGPGPAASLVAFGDEVMRFDCIGEKRGHMHLNMKQTRGFPGEVARLYFREQNIEEQIERCCFELETNLEYALKTNVSRKLRRLRLDDRAIKQASSFLRSNMLDLIARHEPDPLRDSTDAPAMSKTPN